MLRHCSRGCLRVRNHSVVMLLLLLHGMAFGYPAVICIAENGKVSVNGNCDVVNYCEPQCESMATTTCLTSRVGDIEHCGPCHDILVGPLQSDCVLISTETKGVPAIPHSPSGIQINCAVAVEHVACCSKVTIRCFQNATNLTLVALSTTRIQI